MTRERRDRNTVKKMKKVLNNKKSQKINSSESDWKIN